MYVLISLVPPCRTIIHPTLALTQCGGISGLLAVAALVRAHNANLRSGHACDNVRNRSSHRGAGVEDVRLVPHSPYFGPGLLATLHFLAAVDSGTMPISCTCCRIPVSQRYCCDSLLLVTATVTSCPCFLFLAICLCLLTRGTSRALLLRARHATLPAAACRRRRTHCRATRRPVWTRIRN
jgi:hypothetical protein